MTYESEVMVMTPTEDELFAAVNRLLTESGDPPASSAEFDAASETWAEDYHERRDGLGIANLITQQRQVIRHARQHGVLERREGAAPIVALQPPPWWKLYCYRYGEECWGTWKRNVRAVLGLEKSIAPEEQRMFLETLRDRSLVPPDARWKSWGDPPPRIHYRLAPDPDDAQPVRVSSVEFIDVQPPFVLEEVILEDPDDMLIEKFKKWDQWASDQPLAYLKREILAVARLTGASEEACLSFLLCDEPLMIPWVECRCHGNDDHETLWFELRVGSQAVPPSAVAAAYTQYLQLVEAPIVKSSAIEEDSVNLIIEYERALKRFPKRRGPANKGVKARRLASLPAALREHFGEDPDTVDKIYHRKIAMLPDYLKPKGGDDYDETQQW